jgi:hypothetical protein
MSHQVARVRTAQESALALVQAEFRDYHPLVGLARLAHRTEVQADPRLELEVHKAILPYVTPKLASMEVKEVPSDDRRVIVTLFEDVEVVEETAEGRLTTSVPVQIPMVVEDATELVPLD